MRESCHGISRVVQIYTFPSRVNHYFHDNFLHFTREILRDITRGTSRVCEVIVELYRIYHDYQHIPHTKFLGHRIEHHILTLFHHFQQALKLDANFIVEAWSYNIVKEILHPFTL